MKKARMSLTEKNLTGIGLVKILKRLYKPRITRI